MSDGSYERLSALDSAFLDVEDHNTHMHIGSVGIYDAGPLTRPEGGLDFARIEAFAEGQLYKVPRLRQKLVRIPRLEHPVWVDDRSFNIHYHLRHTALPRPGDLRHLKRLVGRIVSQQLDRGKPLWEMWIVEGVEGGRFAMVGKVHHCVADGIAGTDLSTAVLSADPSHEPESGPPWKPRVAPSPAQLLVDELRHRAALPLDAARAGLRVLSDPAHALQSLREAGAGLAQVTPGGLGKASHTPLNEPIGAHRRFDWIRFDLARVKAISRRMGVKVNDVVLSVLAGPLRELMARRGLDPDALDFRVLVPVNVRGEGENQPGNRVSSLFVPLPLAEFDPIARLLRVAGITRERKSSGQSWGMQALWEAAELSDTATHWLARSISQSQAANLVVTNVPGPPMPLYFLGAQLLEVYPLVPLASTQALGIALFSYNGGLYWGFNSDWDRVPDLHDLIVATGTHFEALAKAVEERASGFA